MESLSQKLRKSKYTVSILLALIISVGIARVKTLGFFQDWQPIGSLPNPGSHIVFAGPNRVVVQSDDGNTFACASPFAAPCWTEDDESWTLIGNYEIQDSPYTARKLSDVAIKELVMIVVPIEEYHGEIRYALLEDGSIWIWQHGNYALLGIWALETCLIYILVGLLTAIIIGKVRSAMQVK